MKMNNRLCGKDGKYLFHEVGMDISTRLKCLKFKSLLGSAIKRMIGGLIMTNDTTTFLREEDSLSNDGPGAVLAAERIRMNYTIEHVAAKLHLRVRIIELLEENDYSSMPEPVFIKGYLRAYAKLLGISADSILNAFNDSYSCERKLDKALWQSRRESNKAENFVKWGTGVFAVIVLMAVAMWWHANKENEHIFSSNFQKMDKSVNSPSEKDIRLTDLSKMRSLLSSSNAELMQGHFGE